MFGDNQSCLKSLVRRLGGIGPASGFVGRAFGKQTQPSFGICARFGRLDLCTGHKIGNSIFYSPRLVPLKEQPSGKKYPNRQGDAKGQDRCERTDRFTTPQSNNRRNHPTYPPG